MSRPNFRVRLDLSKFYHDVRRTSWIYVDGTKMFEIRDIKRRIQQLFNISEEFNLMLNYTEYLPLTEDVRILKENETVMVAPAAEMENETESQNNTTVLPDNLKEFIKSRRISYCVDPKMTQPADISPPKTEPTTSNQQDAVNTFLNGMQSDTSMTNRTCNSVIEEDEIISASESKIPMESEVSVTKRKRVRHRKAKNKNLAVEQDISCEEVKPKKPKIIDNRIISSGKHTRFDMDIEEANNEVVITNQTSKFKSDTDNISSPQELSTLLALRKSSMPLTFMNKKVKEEMVEHMADEETETSTVAENINENTLHTPIKNNVCKNETNEQLKVENKFLNKPISSYEPTSVKPTLHDIIAFKMLKVGEDYTPQVSEYIIGEVLEHCAGKVQYTFQILQGVSEIQEPKGKFTLTEGETEQEVTDKITLDYGQLIEPRLIFSSETQKSTSSADFSN